MTRLAPLFALLTITSLGAWQQPRFTASGSIVRLDVTVTDARGNVQGLRAEDFDVLDNGRPQQVRVDEFADAPLDLILVVQPFAAIAMTSGAQADKARAGVTAFIGEVQDRDRVGAIVAGAPPTRLRRLETGRPAFQMSAFAEGDEAAPFDAIAAALPEFAKSERRSALVVFTNGVDVRSTVSREALLEAAGRLGPALVLVSSPTRMLDDTHVRAVTTSGVQLAEATAQVSGWVFPHVLEQLAHRSGGFTLDLGRGDPATLMAGLFARLRTRYVISYEPPQGKGWHPVSIKSRRRGAVVSTRDGYFVDER